LPYQVSQESKLKNKIIIEVDDNLWKNYKSYLLTIVNKHTANCRLSYSKRFAYILVEGDARDILTLSNDKRIHVMKSLATLSKYLGCYDVWKQIIERYQLKWSNENSLECFNDIRNNKTNYTNMISWLKKTCSILPKEYGNVLLYCSLTGLRPDEACKSIQLINNDIDNYLNRESMTLEHFKYPDIFIRRTKKAYISIVTEKILELARNSGYLSYNAMRMRVRQNNKQMRMSYCRKIFATHLRMNGVESEIIDILQGRAPKSIFARHYFKPDINNDRIRVVLSSLMKVIL